jgi:two-component system sensor histidine kinase/response regulator
MENNLIKIMAVDDNPDNLITLRALIREMFPEVLVLSANNGYEAFEMISVEEPDVILLDIIMPGMDGFEVCRKLKEDAVLSDIPVIFLTSLKEDKNLRIKALEVGAEGFLSKPIDIHQLTAQIRAMLKIRAANQLKKTEKNRLEIMVANRTMELESELRERKHVEEELRKLNEELDSRVQQRTKELVSSYQDLEAFSSSISHDLRTPLRAIEGFTKIIQNQYKTELGMEGNRLFKLVIDNTDHMNQMIQGMMAISKISSGIVNKKALEMDRMVESVYREIGTQEDREKILLTIEPLEVAYGDHILLKQVWANYLENAVKFTRKIEKPAITVGCFAKNNQIVYFVKDNGCGFNPEYQTKLFQMFQRLHHQEEFPGTGIGLAIVERIIRKHGGKVWAEGVEGVGATFYFSLPEENKRLLNGNR